MSLPLTKRGGAASSRRRAATTYYVDTAGSNSNNGQSTGAPWQTIAKVNAAALNPGDTVLFKRGQTFTGATLLIGASGTSTTPITVGAYGTGNPPIFDGGGTDTTLGTRTPIVLNGNWLVLDGVQAQHSLKDGIQVAGTDCTVQNCIVTHNQQGLHVQPTGHRAKILSNQFLHNDLVFIGAGANDDSGAVAMVLNADSCVVQRNYSTGHSGASPDYGTDGSFCEIYGASGTEIAYNLSVDDKTFTELGGDSTDPDYGLPSNNLYHHNVVITSLVTSSVMTLNGTGTFGPTTGTVFEHNTVYASAVGAYGLGVESGADLVFKNNIWAFPNGNPGNVLGSPIDESNNLYWGTPSNIKSSNSASGTTVDETSVVANPLFVDAPNGDLRLRAGSPALNIGAPLGYTVDYDGHLTPIGAAPDAGAFEFDPSVTTAPRAPSGVTGAAGDGQATVTFVLGYNGNTPITGSLITANPGGATATVAGTGTSGTVTGLTNGTSYTFTVTSTNAVGTSPASAASPAVVPTAAVAPTVRASANAASATCNKPTGTTSGDLLLAFHAADAGLATEMGAPAGWTQVQVADAAINTVHLKLWKKTATGSEPTSYTFTQNASSDICVTILAVQNGTTVTAGSVVTRTDNPSSLAAPSVTPSAAPSLLVGAGAITGAVGVTWTPPTGMTEISDRQSGSSCSMETASQALSTTAATGTKTFTASQPSGWGGAAFLAVVTA